MKLSVIIVTYKNGKVLLDCLNSIYKYNDLDDELEVIVVDNSPLEDNIFQYVNLSLYKGVKYVSSNNRGFGAGNNLGVKFSSGEVLAFLNADVVLVEPIFKKIYTQFHNNSNLEILGIKLLNKDFSVGFSFGFDFNNSFIHKFLLRIYNKIGFFDSNTMFILGADLFVRKSSFIKAGKFDENFFMYFEEPDLKKRIINNNKSGIVKFDSSLKMVHIGQQSTPSGRIMLSHFLESLKYYSEKYNLDYFVFLKHEINYIKFKMFLYKLFFKKSKYDISIIQLEEFRRFYSLTK